VVIPFLFELRSILDWTFTRTSLDVWCWMKLASIQADMYVAKCLNMTYAQKKLGEVYGKAQKIFIGCSLILVIILLLVGPLFLFSNLNPTSEQISTTGSSLMVSMLIKNGTDSNYNIGLFKTVTTVSDYFINETQYDAL